MRIRPEGLELERCRDTGQMALHDPQHGSPHEPILDEEDDENLTIGVDDADVDVFTANDRCDVSKSGIPKEPSRARFRFPLTRKRPIDSLRRAVAGSKVF